MVFEWNGLILSLGWPKIYKFSFMKCRGKSIFLDESYCVYTTYSWDIRVRTYKSQTSKGLRICSNQESFYPSRSKECRYKSHFFWKLLDAEIPVTNFPLLPLRISDTVGSLSSGSCHSKMTPSEKTKAVSFTKLVRSGWHLKILTFFLS